MRVSPVFRIFLLLAATSCKPASENVSTGDPEGLTPVTVTHVTIGRITDEHTLRATSAFLLKTYVKSDLNGYIRKVNIQLGKKIAQGEELFEIRSKESQHLGNTISLIDSSLHLSGTVKVYAPAAGYITSLSFQAGDYVQDNEVLATISDLSSLVFLLELPYELKAWLEDNKVVELRLPDGEIYQGLISSSLPTVDPVAQTQSYMIRIKGAISIPENLVATVKFCRRSKSNAVILPKDAILSNETQSEFWLMKMIDSTTAVRVPVVKGLETSDKAEIISPMLTGSDLILLTGNYGLPDTAKVIIQNK
jgi:hypothetical protein